ncbi:MAG: YHS domain-containing protein [Actinomycetes bacterium]
MGSCCSTNNTPNNTTTENLTLSTCPVMAGSPVVKAAAEAAGLYRDYEGNRYWFCCAGCGPAFDADPAKYGSAN